MLKRIFGVSSMSWGGLIVFSQLLLSAPPHSSAAYRSLSPSELTVGVVLFGLGVYALLTPVSKPSR